MINIHLPIFQSTWLVVVEITLLFLYCLAALPSACLRGRIPLVFFPGGAGVADTQPGQDVASGRRGPGMKQSFVPVPLCLLAGTDGAHRARDVKPEQP